MKHRDNRSGVGLVLGSNAFLVHVKRRKGQHR
jgi:hypothetical protein